MLSCNRIVLNYAMVLYDKSRTKVQIACDIAKELPKAPIPSFFLRDCWYNYAKVMDAFLIKSFYTIGALRTNRLIFPAGIKRQVSQFAPFIHKTNLKSASLPLANDSIICIAMREI